jgi:hypothetical protein
MYYAKQSIAFYCNFVLPDSNFLEAFARAFGFWLLAWPLVLGTDGLSVKK